jgi:hypothetical protein
METMSCLFSFIERFIDGAAKLPRPEYGWES